jgi:hypothetical protein
MSEDSAFVLCKCIFLCVSTHEYQKTQFSYLKVLQVLNPSLSMEFSFAFLENSFHPAYLNSENLFHFQDKNGTPQRFSEAQRLHARINELKRFQLWTIKLSLNKLTQKIPRLDSEQTKDIYFEK